MNDDVIVLCKWLEQPYDAHGFDPAFTVIGVYATEDGLERRLERIKKSNPQYPLRKIGDRTWRIGPDEDEGFFGNRPVWLRAQTVKVDP